MCQLYREVSGNWGSCGFGRGERNCHNQVGSDNAIMAVLGLVPVRCLWWEQVIILYSSGWVY
jgi:hypothetical protein